MEQQLHGVALLLFEGNDVQHIYMVRERRSKSHIAKQAGMHSIPMETMEENETPDQAVQRLLTEEVGIPTYEIHFIGEIFFDKTRTTVAYTVHCFITVANSNVPACLHSDTEDVERIGWRPIAQLTELGNAGRRELPYIAALFQKHQTQ